MDRELRPGAVHVWRLALDQPPPVVDALGALLDHRERTRAGAFFRPRDGARYTVAHGAVRQILGGYLGRRPQALRFAATERGKPLVEGMGLHFSLSHAGGHALVAVSPDRPVGVDIERVDAERRVGAISERFFTADEASLLDRCAEPDRRAVFFRLWTCKESCVKESGEGIGGIEAVHTTLDARGGIRARSGHTAWRVSELEPAPGYAGAVAVRGEPAVTAALTWTPTGAGAPQASECDSARS